LQRELKSGLFQASGFAALATLALIVVLLLRPVSFDLSLRVYAVALGADALYFVLRLAPLRPVHSAGPLRPRRGRRQAIVQVPGLAELEHAVEFGLTSGFDLHHRLRPALRRIAAARLAELGVDLDRHPERARALLGAEAWALLRPERPAPGRRAKGASAAELERVAQALERLP
jgi:hypothetical protein